jgi:hypothetical protein
MPKLPSPNLPACQDINIIYINKNLIKNFNGKNLPIKLSIANLPNSKMPIAMHIAMWQDFKNNK